MATKEDFTARAADIAANCPIVCRGTDWGPVPLWSAELAELNSTCDLHAESEDDARAQLAELIAKDLEARATRA